jgi:type II secretion system protein H
MRFDARNYGRRLGFTLIELMVVIVLIGIMTAVIIPEMKGTYEDALLRATGRELVNVCNIAYSRAVSLNQLHRVRLDRKSGRYLVERRVRESGRGSGFLPVRDVPGSEGKLDTRIAIEIQREGEIAAEALDETLPSSPENETSAGADAFTFYPDGTANAAEIRLRDREGFRLALRINPTTARVRIIDLGRE